MKKILLVLLFILSIFQQAFSSPELATNFQDGGIPLLVTGHEQYISQSILLDQKLWAMLLKTYALHLKSLPLKIFKASHFIKYVPDIQTRWLG